MWGLRHFPGLFSLEKKKAFLTSIKLNFNFLNAKGSLLIPMLF